MYDFHVEPGFYTATVLSAEIMEEGGGMKRSYVNVKLDIEGEQAPPTKIWLTEKALGSGFAQSQLQAIGLDLAGGSKLSDLVGNPELLAGQQCEAEVEETISNTSGRPFIRVNIIPTRAKAIEDPAKVAKLDQLLAGLKG